MPLVHNLDRRFKFLTLKLESLYIIIDGVEAPASFQIIQVSAEDET